MFLLFLVLAVLFLLGGLLTAKWLLIGALLLFIFGAVSYRGR